MPLHRLKAELRSARGLEHGHAAPARQQWVFARLLLFTPRMAEDDFDLASLADYLHLDVPQVARLVERGKIPGRRVAGTWRFSRPEIHHWLETRIGLSDEEELARVEGALERSTRVGDEQTLSIAELLPIEAIAVPLVARTKNSVITSMTELAAQTGWLWDPQAMAEALRQREEMHPTALDNGVALLHPRRPMSNILGQAFLALGITDQGIPFGAPRGNLTDVFFLICSISDQGHLKILARLSRLINSTDFLAELRSAPDAHSAHELFVAREKELLGT
jgi:PTS system nitrogen regulatory IIA component